MQDPMFKIKVENEKDDYGLFIIEPLEQGYGQTLGNSLRRVLLTSLPGAAITSVKIDGVRHQFSTLSGMKEDIVEFLLNVKKVRMTLSSDERATLTLAAKGPATVTAGDFNVPAGVAIANPDLVLASLAGKKSTLTMEAVAEKGYGYLSVDERKEEEVGKIPVSAVFSPVKRVNYRVEATRVGRMTNLDKLVLEIWTDASMHPREALKNAATILISYFMQVVEPKKAIPSDGVAVTPAISDEILKMRIEELDIPTRVANSLGNGGIETVGQLLGTPRSELMNIKNLGVKSLSLVEEKLREKGVALTV